MSRTNKTAWSAEGFEDLNKLSRVSSRHASSKDHLYADLSLNNHSKPVFRRTGLLNEH